MSFPLVSVIIPTFNSSIYLEKAILSIVNQTYKYIEIIIIDDGSTDNTFEICKKLIFKFRNIKYYKQENQGISTALNNGIIKSSGKFIARMDSDDIALPNRIEKQVDFLLKNPNFALVSSSYYLFTSNNVCVINHPSDFKIISLLLCFCCPICHPSVMIKKEIIELYMYNNLSYAEDHELWCRIALNQEITNINEPLIYYRKHEKSLSQLNLNKIRLSLLLNGFNFFKSNYAFIARITFTDFFKAKQEHKNFKWLLGFHYLILAKILYHIKK